MGSAIIRVGFLGLILCCCSGAGYAQISTQLKMGASVFDTVIIGIETKLEVKFVDKTGSVYTVNPELGIDAQLLQNPATIRITGSPVEIMIDIEVDKIFSSDDEEGQAVVISDFNLMEKDAGSSVVIMPYSDEISFLLVVGGTISGASDLSERYTGLNVLSINYL